MKYDKNGNFDLTKTQITLLGITLLTGYIWVPALVELICRALGI